MGPIGGWAYGIPVKLSHSTLSWNLGSISASPRPMTGPWTVSTSTRPGPRGSSPQAPSSRPWRRGGPRPVVLHSWEMQLLSSFLQELQQSGREKRPWSSRSFRKAMSASNLGVGVTRCLCQLSRLPTWCPYPAGRHLAAEAPPPHRSLSSSPPPSSSSQSHSRPEQVGEPRPTWQFSAWQMYRSTPTLEGQTREQMSPRPAMSTMSLSAATTRPPRSRALGRAVRGSSGGLWGRATWPGAPRYPPPPSLCSV